MSAFTTSQTKIATKVIGKLAPQPGFAPGIVAALLLLQLGLVRLLAAADANHVWLLERNLHIGCWFREAFGVPCPACGLTRSVIMTLHGDFQLAWGMNPAGLLAVVGAVLFSFAMLWLMILHQRRATTVETRQTTQQAIKRATLVYAGLLMLVLLTHWVAEV